MATSIIKKMQALKYFEYTGNITIPEHRIARLNIPKHQGESDVKNRISVSTNNELLGASLAGNGRIVIMSDNIGSIGNVTFRVWYVS